MDQLSIGIKILKPIKVLSILIFVVLFTTGCSNLSINKDLQETINYKQTQSYQDSEKEFNEFASEEFTTKAYPSTSNNSASGGSLGILLLLLFLYPFKFTGRVPIILFMFAAVAIADFFKRNSGK